jgi:hypothetical protein
VKIREWDLGLSCCDLEDLKGVLELVDDMKKRGVTGAVVARSFCRRMIQPIKDWVHPSYEYWGQSDPTREINRKVSKEEMAARVSQIYSGKVKVKKCPKAHSLKRPADPVRSCDLLLCRLLRSPFVCVVNFLGPCLVCRCTSV